MCSCLLAVVDESFGTSFAFFLSRVRPASRALVRSRSFVSRSTQEAIFFCWQPYLYDRTATGRDPSFARLGRALLQREKNVTRSRSASLSVFHPRRQDYGGEREKRRRISITSRSRKARCLRPCFRFRSESQRAHNVRHTKTGAPAILPLCNDEKRRISTGIAHENGKPRGFAPLVAETVHQNGD